LGSLGWLAVRLVLLALIALTVTFHVWFMRTPTRRSEDLPREEKRRPDDLFVRRPPDDRLHIPCNPRAGIEGTFWALAYLALGALTNARAAMLYSFNAITSFGHTSIGLADHWQLMGALEALNGILLFGVSTAFLFRLIGQFEIAGDDHSRDR
jgi:hypothetical protein